MWKTVYELRNNPALIEGIRQRARQPDPPYRFPHGEVGSAAWWAAIASGKLPRQTFEGTIWRYQPVGGEPGQEARFSLTDAEGVTSEWPAFGEWGYHRFYRVGQRVRIVAVPLQVVRGSNSRRELVLRIQIGVQWFWPVISS